MSSLPLELTPLDTAMSYWVGLPHLSVALAWVCAGLLLRSTQEAANSTCESMKRSAIDALSEAQDITS